MNDNIENDHIEWDTLDRYFDGTLSPAETRAIARWAAGDPAREEYLASVRRIWQESAATDGRFDVNAAWREMQGRLAGEHNAQPLAPGARARTLHLYPAADVQAHRSRRPYLRLAAAAALLVAAGASAFWYRTGAHSRAHSTASALPMRQYATATGQRAEILLSDGTRALLSVESHLRIPADYDKDARDVYLDGEAYFAVRHDEQKPFRVHVVGGVAEDLGTEFVVRAYPGDSSITVVVASGRVALQSDSSSVKQDTIALGPGQLGRLHDSGRVTVSSDIDVDGYLSWTRGRIAFRDVPFATVARELERWYDVDIEIADSSLARTTLIASFDNQPLDDVLRIVARSLDARYTRKGRLVRFTPRSATQ